MNELMKREREIEVILWAAMAFVVLQKTFGPEWTSRGKGLLDMWLLSGKLSARASRLNCHGNDAHTVCSC
jgi:hypothetical protein